MVMTKMFFWNKLFNIDIHRLMCTYRKSGNRTQLRTRRRIRVDPTPTVYARKRHYSPRNSLASNNISNYLALVKKSPYNNDWALPYAAYAQKCQYSSLNSLASNNISNCLALVKKIPYNNDLALPYAP